MDANTIRAKFLRFFEKKGHVVVPSAPLVLKDDPTLMFVNAGMVQFKDYFLGNAVPKNDRLVNTQRCLRVSGKHNDLEEVGLDTYHHTMFEMLGNWSFGSYFKKEAILWAWELLTKEYGLPTERLYISVFGGDKEENLSVDEESLTFWNDIVDKSRIVYGVKKDNFWEMGDTGPCGPCSEIHIDLRPEKERMVQDGVLLVNKDHPLVVEIWNLVFIEFNRLQSGELEILPKRHVDTGMGLERLCMVMQHVLSSYESDLFTPLINFIARKACVRYGDDEKKDIAIRVLADHIRAVAFTIADGQMTSNTGAGYVVRRILRRALRYGFSSLNFEEPFLYTLIPILSEQFKQIFPNLHSCEVHVMKVIEEEEKTFLRTLDKGLTRLEKIERSAKNKRIEGETAFELYDTYGFPFDLTSLIARERGFIVDKEGFLKAMQLQKHRSKTATSREVSDWHILKKSASSTFVGYDKICTQAELLRYRQVRYKDRMLYQLVYSQTPFYAESGGQVADTGVVSVGTEHIPIVDVQKENDLIIHFTEKTPVNTSSLFTLRINEERRKCIAINHTATHLLHAALKQVLGQHVEQRGSLVHDKSLRFDFSHFTSMKTEEIKEVEHIVNTKIRDNICKEERLNVPLNDAKNMGATALFGEKYGENVRVITFDASYSIELCGGTHVDYTGDIGFFKIISESTIAAGVRRVEAITAAVAEEYVSSQTETLQAIKQLLKGPKDLVKSIETLSLEKNSLSKKLNIFYQKQSVMLQAELSSKGTAIDDIYFIAEKIEAPTLQSLKDVAHGLRKQRKDLLMVLASDVDRVPYIVVALGDNIVKKKIHAGKLAKELAIEIKGGGGGQAFFAMAGGKQLDGLSRVLQKARQIVMQVH